MKNPTNTTNLPHPMKRANMLAWMISLFSIFAFVLCVQGQAQAQQNEMPPAKVRTVPVEKRMLSPQIQVPGTVISRNDARISAEVSGRLTSVAEVGETFTKGEIIATIDDRSFAAEVKRLRADLNYQEKNLERIEELASSSFSSVSSLEQATADKEMAEAALEQALHNLERTKIRAPFSGIVVERVGQVGEYATAGTQLLRLVDTENVEISARVPISSAPYINGLNTVFVEANNEGYSLPVRSVVPVGDDRSRMMEIRVSAGEAPWVVGTAVRVDVPSGPANEVLAVPRDALILRSNDIYLFTVGEEDTAQRVSVRLGAASGDYVEVRGNVAEGQQVAVRGGERLREGQKVATIADNL